MTKISHQSLLQDAGKPIHYFLKMINIQGFLHVFHSTQKVGEEKLFIKELQQIKARGITEL